MNQKQIDAVVEEVERLLRKGVRIVRFTTEEGLSVECVLSSCNLSDDRTTRDIHHFVIRSEEEIAFYCSFIQKDRESGICDEEECHKWTNRLFNQVEESSKCYYQSWLDKHDLVLEIKGLDEAPWAVSAVRIPDSQAGNKLISAFGDQKTKVDWTRDSRCQVNYPTLIGRLSNGWEAEKAISEPFQEAEMVEAYGERKSVPSWGNDPRCQVGYGTLAARLRRGWDAERAISEPSSRAKKAGE